MLANFLDSKANIDLIKRRGLILLSYKENKLIKANEIYTKVSKLVKQAIKKIEVGNFKGYSKELVRVLLDLIEQRDRVLVFTKVENPKPFKRAHKKIPPKKAKGSC